MIFGEPVELPASMSDPQWTSRGQVDVRDNQPVRDNRTQPVVMPRRQSVAETVEIIASARRDRNELAAQVATLREQLESSRAMVAQLRARLDVAEREAERMRHVARIR